MRGNSVLFSDPQEHTQPRAPKTWCGIQGKPRWPASLVTAVALAIVIGMQLLLPSPVAFQPLQWVLPVLEALLLVGLVARPRRIDRESPRLRVAILALIAAISLINAWSVVLVVGLILGSEGHAANPLLANGVVIWSTNVIVFALWYWELERGRPYSDFLFVQMQSPDLAPPEWEPTFTDYLYLSFTNATAFGPADVLPLSRWAKLTMMFQAAVSLSTIAVIIAKAIDALN